MKHIRPHRTALGFRTTQRWKVTSASVLTRAINVTTTPTPAACSGSGRTVLNAGEKQEQRRAGDKHALRQRRQRLRFAMTKGMFFISRL